MASNPKKGTVLSTSRQILGATPQVATKVVATGTGGVKVSTPSLNATNFLMDNMGYQDEDYANLILDAINARELTSLTKSISLVATNPIYQPIKNLADSNFYNSSQMIAPNENTETSYFKSLPINLFTKVPTSEELLAESEVDSLGNPVVVYFDTTSMSIVINLKNVIDEEVEVSFVSFTSLNDDTIY